MKFSFRSRCWSALLLLMTIGIATSEVQLVAPSFIKNSGIVEKISSSRLAGVEPKASIEDVAVVKDVLKADLKRSVPRFAQPSEKIDNLLSQNGDAISLPFGSFLFSLSYSMDSSYSLMIAAMDAYTSYSYSFQPENPTARPTTRSTRRPTSARPTRKPTNAKPTNTAFPTESTGAPSIGSPTNTHSPNATPGPTNPTKRPTRKPSPKPSPAPTRFPTAGQPTFLPFPGAGAVQVAHFISTQNIVGVSAADWHAEEKIANRVFSRAVARAFHNKMITYRNISVLSVEDFRHTSAARPSLVSVKSADVAKEVQVTYSVTISAYLVGYFSANDAFEIMSARLVDAIMTGEFDDLLQEEAGNANSALSGCTSGTVSITPMHPTTSPTQVPSGTVAAGSFASDPIMGSSSIAGIAVGCTVAVLILAAVAYLVRRRQSQKTVDKLSSSNVEFGTLYSGHGGASSHHVSPSDEINPMVSHSLTDFGSTFSSSSSSSHPTTEKTVEQEEVSVVVSPSGSLDETESVDSSSCKSSDVTKLMSGTTNSSHRSR